MDLNTLNKEQKIAVEHKNGPLLVLSGAGTGKTRVLTSRFVYIVKNLNVNFNKIIAVTFTNKAANEIKTRVNIELKKTIIVRVNVWNKIPPRITIDIIGVKFGGCGISLEKTKRVIKKQILLFLLIIFIIRSLSDLDKISTKNYS